MVKKKQVKLGRPLMYGPRSRCSADGCRAKPQARGLCARCYHRAWQRKSRAAKLGRRGRREDAR